MRCRNRRKLKIKTILRLCLILFIALISAAILRIRQTFMEYATNICEDSAMQEINRLMQEKVFSDSRTYADMVTLERDNENRVTALRTDVIRIGSIKAQLINNLFERLAPLEHMMLPVPLGTIFAPHFFTGAGPSIEIGMAGLTQVSADFISAFSAAGINQTRHNIIIEVRAGFRILTPLGGEEREVVTSYPVTDTVIVGTVPEQYVYIDNLTGGYLGEIPDDMSAHNSNKIGT